MAASESEEVFDVERIVDERVYKGKQQYMIKWEGYPETDNTWEDKENLMCEDLLKEYIDRKKKANTKNANTVKKSQPTKKEPEKEKEKVKEKEPVKKTKQVTLFTQKITNEWDEQIDKVTGASMNEDNTVQIEFTLKDGTRASALSEELRYKAPLKLLDFYEANLSFPE